MRVTGNILEIHIGLYTVIVLNAFAAGFGLCAILFGVIGQ